MKAFKRYTILLGVGLFAFSILSFIEVAIFALGYTNRGWSLGLPDYLVLFVFWAIVVKLQNSKWRSPLILTYFTAALGYISFLCFWIWVLLGTPTAN